MDQKKSINNIQDVGLLAKCGCIMCITIVYTSKCHILSCSIQESQHPNFEFNKYIKLLIEKNKSINNM